jgi:phospholipid/cholesterol/gamma-HCH transport system permease protein
VALMSFLIGLIVAQQGGFYLRQFGAGVFVVDLIGVLVLRELGVLLTAIMIAGRSGSAFTAEIGAMKMQEEIDALRVIGLEPLEVLVLPKMMALILALPVLTFIADISALLGAILISWTYLGITPVNFIARLHEAVSPHELYIGLIKAPFFAIIIGLIACMEGLKVGGSAESLGLRTTNSVVKAIFMVIVVDGVFAIFFASIGVRPAWPAATRRSIPRRRSSRRAASRWASARRRSSRTSISTSIAARSSASSAAPAPASRC